MRESLKLYFQLARGGFFKQSYIFLVMILVGFFIIGPRLGVDIISVIFTFLSMGIFSDLDEKKYTLASSLPFKLKERIKMLYVNTYSVCLLGAIGIQISYLIRGEFRFIAAICMAMLPGIMGCHLYYIIFSSSEFKKDPQEQTGSLMAFTFGFTIVGMILFFGAAFVKGGIIGHWIIQSSLFMQTVLCIVLIVLTALMNKASYKIVCQQTFISDHREKQTIK